MGCCSCSNSNASSFSPMSGGFNNGFNSFRTNFRNGGWEDFSNGNFSNIDCCVLGRLNSSMIPMSRECCMSQHMNNPMCCVLEKFNPRNNFRRFW